MSITCWNRDRVIYDLTELGLLKQLFIDLESVASKFRCHVVRSLTPDRDSDRIFQLITFVFRRAELNYIAG